MKPKPLGLPIVTKCSHSRYKIVDVLDANYCPDCKEWIPNKVNKNAKELDQKRRIILNSKISY